VDKGPARTQRYPLVVGIETIPNADPAKHSDIVERLACGHFGVNHGATWKGTPSGWEQRPAQYRWLIGKKRYCRTCSQLATQGG
jgi:hypothetical protein